MGKIRLDKFLADMGLGTRSEVKKEIKKGSIQVNGMTVKNPEYKIDTGKDQVTAKGQQVSYAELEYYMLNKPAGVVSATEDKREKTVVDLITEKRRKGLSMGTLELDENLEPGAYRPLTQEEIKRLKEHAGKQKSSDI